MTIAFVVGVENADECFVTGPEISPVAPGERSAAKAGVGVSQIRANADRPNGSKQKRGDGA